ncbi:transcriptional regulator [Oenococcus oeni]|uniref:Helix-turn-helix domain-containing protein n=1 Tax=Oenococcus oeni TaxID=1247 RepID=A0AAJ2P1P1_OENOE|nr:helix-turn-helix transcriptional regulator [Oenococcus oeni]MDV7714880.1 helix-turn-helix domain-containing protein [Oenococcus oeni]OIM25285.1 transcriptional regulator [Oenococcus oeni]
MAKFPEQLKKYRNKKNLSQKDLAGKLFISRQAISKWESGETTPDLNNLIKLSELLDVSLDTLVLGSEEQNSRIDNKQFSFDPNSGNYKRKYGQMNVWDFLARFWWLIFAIGGFIAWIIRGGN